MINIITKDNGRGISRDTAILAGVLRRAGFKVSIYEVSKPTLGHKWDRVSSYGRQKINRLLWGKPAYDVNLFIEAVIPEWFEYAGVNCLIPNQEWFLDQWLPFLSGFDYILCKTRFAQDVFSGLCCKTEFISFTSDDRYRILFHDRQLSFFHLGSGGQKNTRVLIDLWLKHPEWPTLTLIQNPECAYDVLASNINSIVDYISDEDLLVYQNSCWFHLYPSIAEGFGHCLNEAMSCGAITLTTDAPPMNELVGGDRGVLVNYDYSESFRLGTNYYVDLVGLEKGIDYLLGLDDGMRKCMGINARRWYDENDVWFKKRLVEVIGGLY